MLNNFLKNFPVSLGIIITFILTIIIFISQSIYLIIFLTLLILIINLLTGKSVKSYTKFIKLDISLLFLAIIIYIIIVGIKVEILLYIYKFLLLIALLNAFFLSIDFCRLDTGIFTLLGFLKFNDKNAQKASRAITSMVYTIHDVYINYNSINSHKKLLGTNNKLKYKFISSLLSVTFNQKRQEESLKLKFYKPQKENIKLIHLFFTLCFVGLFILAFIKEVIL